MAASARHAEYEKGIQGCFADVEGQVNPGQDLPLLYDVTGKSGTIDQVRMMTKVSNKIELKVFRDGEMVTAGWKGLPSQFMETYGCCGNRGIVTLERYDTISDKYILQVNGPLEFKDSFEVRVKNWDGDNPQKCAVDIDWVENS